MRRRVIEATLVLPRTPPPHKVTTDGHRLVHIMVYVWTWGEGGGGICSFIMLQRGNRWGKEACNSKVPFLLKVSACHVAIQNHSSYQWTLGYPNTCVHSTFLDKRKVRITEISTFSIAELAKLMLRANAHPKCNGFPCRIIEVLDNQGPDNRGSTVM